MRSVLGLFLAAWASGFGGRRGRLASLDGKPDAALREDPPEDGLVVQFATARNEWESVQVWCAQRAAGRCQRRTEQFDDGRRPSLSDPRRRQAVPATPIGTAQEPTATRTSARAGIRTRSSRRRHPHDPPAAGTVAGFAGRTRSTLPGRPDPRVLGRLVRAARHAGRASTAAYRVTAAGRRQA